MNRNRKPYLEPREASIWYRTRTGIYTQWRNSGKDALFYFMEALYAENELPLEDIEKKIRQLRFVNGGYNSGASGVSLGEIDAAAIRGFEKMRNFITKKKE